MSQLTYRLAGVAVAARRSLLGTFGGLVQPFTTAASRGIRAKTRPAWERTLWTVDPTRNAILAAWGHSANIVITDGVEMDGFAAAVVGLNAK